MAGYGTDDGFTTWLASNGYSLPGDAPDPAVLRQRGSAYVDGAYGLRFPGTPTGGYAQERAWPRTGATDYYGGAIPENVIPDVVVQASYAAAYQEAASPGSLSIVTTPGAQVRSEQVGSLRVEYFDSSAGGATAAAPVLSAVEGLLAPVLICRDQPAVYVV